MVRQVEPGANGMASSNPHDQNLDRDPANFAPLTR
jgi:hypothetical protein